MHSRIALAAFLLVGLGEGCGSGHCPFQILARLYLKQTVECCGAAVSEVVTVSHDDAEVDLTFAGPAGPPAPAHAWLTSADCTQLFEGTYPPAAGAPAPRCPTFLGPVSPGEVSTRRNLERGNYRIWVQAFSTSPGPLKAIVDVGVWGKCCGCPGTGGL
jgi:hypothetical protein